MFERELGKGRVQDLSDFDNQVSSNVGVVVGHELGHASDNQNDEPYGANVQEVENPIRSGVGEDPRLKYGDVDVPQEEIIERNEDSQ